MNESGSGQLNTNGSAAAHGPRRGFVLGLALMLALCAGTEALAVDIPWRSSRFQYLAQKKDLGELLREFAASEGITVTVGESVEGAVNGKFDLPPQSMLELLSASHGFLWYYDGSVLHITPSNAVRTEVVQLRLGNIDQLRAMLARLNIHDPRFPIQVEGEGNTMVVSGPSRYVELVRQAAESLERSQGRRQPTEIRIYTLKFAWAADHEMRSGGRSLTVPGVASVLRSMFSPRNAEAAKSGLLRGLRNVPPLKPPTARVGDANAAGNAAKTTVADEAVPDVTEELPVIQADTRINAVLIRDLPARLHQYDALIGALDVRPAMIEIEARIIEVSNEEAERIGIDWQSDRTKDGATRSFQYGDPSSPLPLPAAANFFPSAGVLSTVSAAATRNFLARIQALAQEGKAKINASPKVVTLNNLEARMDNVDEFFIRVAGAYSAELFNVSTGVNLHVTPLIVSEGGQQRIKLDVRIEDGRLGESSVDQIPVVKKSEINTQAFINDGEALLIAGYSLDRESKSEGGVPVLSKIPLLGALFRYQQDGKSTMQRMFLLTPRVVTEQASADKPDAAKPAVASTATTMPMSSTWTAGAMFLNYYTEPPAALPQTDVTRDAPAMASSPPAAHPAPIATPAAQKERPASKSPPAATPDFAVADAATARSIFGFGQPRPAAIAAPGRGGQSAPASAGDNCNAARQALNLCGATDRATLRPAVWVVPVEAPLPASVVTPAAPPARRTIESDAHRGAPRAVSDAVAADPITGQESPRVPAVRATVSRAVKSQCPAAAVVLGTCVAKREE